MNEIKYYCLYKLNDQGLIDVVGSVYLSNIKIDNLLISLEYSPIRVGKNFDCRYNKLITLEGCSKEIQGDLDCRHNKIEHIDHIIHSKIKGKIFTLNNKIHRDFNEIKDIEIEF